MGGVISFLIFLGSAALKNLEVHQSVERIDRENTEWIG